MRLRMNVVSVMLVLANTVWILGSAPLQAGIIRVDASSTSVSPDGGSWETAYADLQDALGAAVSGDEIWVAKGIYKPTTASDTAARFEPVDGVGMYGGFTGNESSRNERDYANNKTYLSGDLDGGLNSIRIIYASGISNYAVVDGFEITGADKGVWCSGTKLAIANCVIAGNSDYGVYCSAGSTISISNSVIKNNVKRGIWCNGLMNVEITNNVIRDNGTDGLYCLGRTTVIRNNLIHNNGGDGIYFASPNSDDIVSNNTVVYNSGNGIYNDELLFYSPTIFNCVVWGNGDDLFDCEATYSCLGDPCDLGLGNIYTDPDFKNAGAGDFHLNGASPCVNAGDPCGVYDGQVDIDGDSRVMGGLVDIGADELDMNIADFNGDGYVNMIDHSILAGTWRNSLGQDGWDDRCDFDGDDVVDVNDLAVFVEEWGWQADWLTVEPEDVYDYDGDGIVGVSDLSVFMDAWLSKLGWDNWDGRCDYDDSEDIDLIDFAEFAGQWKK